MKIFKKLLLIALIAVAFVSCQFTETMVLNEDGTGRMSISMDLSEMMAFSGEMVQDSTMVKQDTIVSFKDLLEQKKDSIAQLPMGEQKRLKAMENYKMQLVTDPETNKMVIDVFTDFKNISEANDLMKGFDQSQNVIPGMSTDTSSEENKEEPDVIGVSYTYNKGKFKRDAFIKDLVAHKTQVDSLKNAEAFMSGITYKVKYTFPRKIKSASAEDATFSLDGKTLEIQRSFLDYLKNPDVLDIEVELEN